MQVEAQYMEDATAQSVHDRSVIDHLISTFHSAEQDSAPASEPVRAVYDLIRTERQPTLTFGTRG